MAKRKSTPQPQPAGDGLDIPEFLRRTKNAAVPDIVVGTQQPAVPPPAPQRHRFDVPLCYTEDEYLALRARLEAKGSRKKNIAAIDHTNEQWDSRRCRWIPLLSKPKDEATMARRWRIVPYDAAGEIIQRGVTSIEEGTDQVQLTGKMAHAFHRCNKGSVHTIRVLDAADGWVRVWEADKDSPLPKLTKEEEAEAEAEAPPAPKAKAKGDGQAKPKAKRQGPPRSGPGVIATIAAMLKGKGGASVDEMVAGLVEQFPDRQESGMRNTVRAQITRQKAEKRDDKKRGVVFFVK